MKAPGRGRLRTLGTNAAAVRSVVGGAMRRPGTYPSFAKEVLLAGLNLILYPAGVISTALEVETSTRLGDRFTQVPLRYLAPDAASTPIVLLHGAFHNRSAFLLMRRALRRFGFRFVDTMNYNVIGHDVPELAAQLAAHVDEVLERAGATHVHLIGHSFGGLVARYYVQELDGHEKVHTCITLGTPHRGTYAAIVGRGRAARQLRPGSHLIRQLAQGARRLPVRFVSFYSNLDSLVLPASNGKIVEPALRARNILVKDVGHLSLLTSRALIRSIAEMLSSLDDAEVRPLRARPAPNGHRARGARGA